MEDNESRAPIFPKWLDSLRPVIAVGVFGILPVYLVALAYYAGSPRNTDVGYQPEQPVQYSHALHAGELGIDCRYCHTTVEKTAGAAIPPTQTCMNCHAKIYPDSPLLLPVRESYSTGLSVPWVRVHDLPDYVYFNHSAHVSRGVGCVECHGRVDKMEVVYQAEPLSMGWCLDCHRDPAPHLRPLDKITDLAWEPHADERAVLGARLQQELNIHPSEDCSTCHR
jgi:hypothetical protein